MKKNVYCLLGRPLGEGHLYDCHLFIAHMEWRIVEEAINNYDFSEDTVDKMLEGHVIEKDGYHWTIVMKDVH